MRLNTAEKLEAAALRADGWTLHRNGWPDFLAEKDGKFRFIEVKQYPQRLSANQIKMCRALFRLTGLKFEVKQYNRSNRARKRAELRDIKQAELLAWARKYKHDGKTFNLE